MIRSMGYVSLEMWNAKLIGSGNESVNLKPHEHSVICPMPHATLLQPSWKLNLRNPTKLVKRCNGHNSPRDVRDCKEAVVTVSDVTSSSDHGAQLYVLFGFTPLSLLLFSFEQSFIVHAIHEERSLSLTIISTVMYHKGAVPN
jgi:hypothetical protein